MAKHKSGEKAPSSGEFEIIGPKGATIMKNITVKKGHPLPPTPKKNQHFEKQS